MSSPPRGPPLLPGRPRSIASQSQRRAVNTSSSSGTTASDQSFSDHSNLPHSNLLLGGLDISNNSSSFLSPDNDKHEIVPPRPRRLWKVHDTKLPSYPTHLYPPPNRQSSCYVTDAPPSVIAVRIAECLRRRSAAVEYDEETCTATVVTVDRCSLQIHLWRWQQQHGTTTNSVVLVECVRTRGPAATFHWTTKAILLAAQSLDAGDDEREWTHASPGEFPRIFGQSTTTPSRTTLPQPSSKEQTQNIVQSLEEAVHLLEKDRLGAQLLGMESLVALTDHHCSGIDAALYAALAVLGAPLTEERNSLLDELHLKWIYRLLVDRRLPFETSSEEATVETSERQTPCHTETDTSVTTSSQQAASAVEASASSATSSSLPIEDHHTGLMRSLALVAVANSLTLLAEHQPTVLHTVLNVQARQWIHPSLISALTSDLQGVNRPPSVVQGTRLAGAHEAVLAIRCLEYLGRYVKIQRNEVALLDGARTVGRSTHQLLYQEVSRVYEQLTEEDRSC